ncbi:MAG: transposase [Bacteroidota bacterium]
MSIFRTNQFTALYDKGYHTGSEFKIAHDLKIDTLVAIPSLAIQAPDPAYNAENFTYNPEGDYCICPQNKHLTTTGKWHKAAAYSFRGYATKSCTSCSVKDQCTIATRGKGIHRSEYHQYIQRQSAVKQLKGKNHGNQRINFNFTKP